MKIEIDLINNYLSHCKNQKRLNNHTLKAYKIDLNQFYKYFKKQNITKDILLEYISFLHQNFKPKTTKRKLASINAFFTFLEYEEIIENNPLKKIKSNFKIEKTLPKIISHDDLNKFYTELYKPYNTNSKLKKILALRNIAVVELMMTTGLRVSEICNLKIDSINLKEKYIRVFGKGNKERIIQIENNYVCTALKNYNSIISRNDSCDYFFLNINYHKLSEQTVRNIISQISSKANIKQHITPHMFRHTSLTTLRMAGWKPELLRVRAGHKNIYTTLNTYVHPSETEITEAFNNVKQAIFLEKEVVD